MAVDLAALELELELALKCYDDSISSHSFNFSTALKSPDATVSVLSSSSKYSPLCTPLQPQCTSNMSSARSLHVTNSGSIYYPPAPGHDENSAPAGNGSSSSSSNLSHSSTNGSSAAFASRVAGRRGRGRGLLDTHPSRRGEQAAHSSGDEDEEDELLRDRLHDLHLEQAVARTASKSFAASMAEHEQRFAGLLRDQGKLRRENVELKAQIVELHKQNMLQQELGAAGEAGEGVRSAVAGRGDVPKASAPTIMADLQHKVSQLEADVAFLSAAKEDYRAALEAELSAGALRSAESQKTLEHQKASLEHMQAAATKWKKAAEHEARKARVAAQQRDAVQTAYDKIKLLMIGVGAGAKTKTKSEP